ncbi:NADH-quinone oxidoreductase subunit NuoF [Miniphocaeibacter halophilus]|uniref:NADH-quinone oxidoreductase subunit NuoF n=1 Tax=Miniphocaeibacter halophilus TaxID=2931922 RepID=A0AC61MS64_9FIRM|nr:NADH-quinone oxidoreductase subunit NuoF [Miniphocaeibacter halophilus]QQK08440.1 NADH-quinone oxidoreductase subunit NuoF [Miniphocaeibacter halophilus]
MKQIKNYKELLDLNSTYEKLLHNRLNKSEGMKKEILICGGTGCTSSKSLELLDEMKKLIVEYGLEEKCSAHITGCLGFCEKGPIVKIFPKDTFYTKVQPEDAREIIETDIIKDELVNRLLYKLPGTEEEIPSQDDIPFYKKQLRIALRNCGIINPEVIEEYIGYGGYLALGKCLEEYSREEVIDIIKDSGLRGRGGGGFPTGLKWEFTKNSESDEKYVICNADEGDPGAFMDRSILEGDPHSVIEAMAIAAYVIGAKQGYVYIRAEYPLAIERLGKAIEQAREIGILGDNILGTDFSFNLGMKFGAGAFVCGEETALINSVEGQRGEPNPKPPFPSTSGLYGKPTLINNVETYANIPVIISKGAEWFNSVGTEKSKGTKVFALAGKVNNIGLVEVPMGTTLREILYDIGGGIQKGREFKAVQTGGPSGGCITAEDLDTPIDYDSLVAKGSMMGSGGMIVMDEDNCMVDIAKFYLEFTLDESCGKCTPCRIGNKRLYEILCKISDGKATEEDLDNLEDLSNIIKDTSLCALGQSAPNPVLSTIKSFRKEYEEHVLNHKCPAKICTSLLEYKITDDCIGCTKCAKICPAKCITGAVREVHVIDNTKCIKCGACFNGCPVHAIVKE